MKKEYKKPIVEVITFCNSENILSASSPNVIIKVEEEDGIKYEDWEVD